MVQHEDRTRNRLLSALPDADWQRWRPQLQCVDLTRGQILYEPGRALRHAYFPISAIASLVRGCSCGSSTEVAVVGNESVVGTSLLMGACGTTDGSVVLVSGQAFRIQAQAIQDEFARSEVVRSLLLRYIQALATQIAQSVICYRHHTIEQQVCGWLLHVLDRLQGSEVVVTQELIAGLLSVRRESVTKAVGELQEAGLIHSSRGHIAVLDPVGLERRSCECHAVVRREYERLLPKQPHVRPADPGRWSSPAWKEPQGRYTPQRELESTGAR